MRRNKPRRNRTRTPQAWLLTAVLAGAVSWLSASAWAQDAAAAELSGTVLEATGAWTAAQSQDVQAFVDAQLAAFASDDAEAISAGRQAITEPLNSLKAGPAFQSQYFRLLVQRLKAGVNGWSVIGRVNATMLARRVIDPGVTEVLETGLKDDSAGVRFGAAKTLGELMPNEAMGFNDRDKARLMQVLAGAAAVEPDAFVVGKLLPAIRATGQDGVRSTLINVFNERVVLHAADPGLSYRPELTAMQEVFITGLGKFDRKQTKAFLRAAGRCLNLAAQQLDAGTIPETHRPAAQGMITQAATILDELSRSMKLPGKLPRGVAPALSAGNTGQLVEIAQQWNERLQGSPLSLTPEELSIAAPPGTPGTPEGEAEEEGDPVASSATE